MPDQGPRPVISIVVTIVDGGDALRGFLRAVSAFEDAPETEVILPYDASIPEIPAIAADFPAVRLLDLGAITPVRPITTEAGLHELYDRRRARGLAAARGSIIAILEDRGWPRPDYARKLAELYATTGAQVIGGAIECREPTSRLNWAYYVTDFGRYGRPFVSGPTNWISDINTSYSRAALDEMRPIWEDRFHEPLVHAYMAEKGETLFLSADLVVDYDRAPSRIGPLLAERFHWGRLFGHIRARQVSAPRRLALILAGPLIPPLLWVRHGLTQRRKGRGGRYLATLPLVMLLTTFWTVGEVWGYITRQP